MTPIKSQSEKQEPILLGIESSGVTCAVGVSQGDELLTEIAAHVRNIHSQKLAPFVQQMLDIAGFSASDVNAIVLSAGPGSFTGLRIGYSVAKGLAHALNIPVIEVPTLDIWAYQAGRQTIEVVPVINAHRGEIFCAAFRWDNDEMKKIREDALISPKDLNELFASTILLTGADSQQLFSELEPHLPAQSEQIQPIQAYPQMWALMTLGLEKYQNEQFSDINTCEPLYLRAFKGQM